MAETALVISPAGGDGNEEAQSKNYQPDRFHCLHRFMQVSSSFAMNVFFGDIDVVGLENIPTYGPAILVGNHKNQFVDAMMVVSIVRNRKVSFLVAEKSMHRRIIGDAAKMMDGIPVIRPQDRARSSPGVITGFDPTHNRLMGSNDCLFTVNVKKGEMIIVHGQKGVAPLVIQEVVSDTSVIVKPPVKAEDEVDAGEPASLNIPSQGSSFKVIPKIDQSQVFNKVFDALGQGRCIGIFPEGGSSDRTDLLPLKAGVSIMAVGAAAQGTPVKIIPFGINYNEGHRFRSKVLVDIGKPLTVSEAILERYRMGAKREAQGEFLKQVEAALRGVTFNAPDKHTLNILRTMRRLYQGPVKLPAKRFMELNRRFALAFGKFRDDERFLDLVARVHDYMLKLKHLGVQDRQIAALPPLGSIFISLHALVAMVSTILACGVLALFALPGYLFFLPMLLRVRHVSRVEARKALAGSRVKVKGEDVEASQKIISTFIWAPFTTFVVTGIAIGLTVGLWPRTSPYSGGTALDWFFVNAIWLIPLGVFLIVPACGAFSIVASDFIVKQIRWVPYYRLVVLSAWRTQSDGAKIRMRRKELTLRIQEFYDKIIAPAFPEWKDDLIVSREEILEKRRKSDHHHAIRVAQEIDELAKAAPMPDSPTLPNSRKTIAGLKSSMMRMQESVERFEVAPTQDGQDTSKLSRQNSYGLANIVEDKV